MTAVDRQGLELGLKLELCRLLTHGSGSQLASPITF